MAEEMNTTELTNGELISFCQLMSAAVKSRLPLANALLKHNTAESKTRAVTLAKNIAERLKSGYSIEEASANLKEIDPVVARLMPLIGDAKLIEIFDIYTKYLIRREMCSRQMKFLVTYPFIVMLMGITMLLFFNFKIFPGIHQLVHDLSFFEGLSLHLLYFANVSYWPLSLIVPAIILYLFIDSFYVMMTGRFIKRSLWGRVTGLYKAIRLCEKARLAAMLSLYMKAGFTFENSVSEVAAFSEPVSEGELHRVQSKLASGNTVSDSMSASALLSEIMNGHETFEEMPEKLEYISQGLNAEAMMVLDGVSAKLYYLSLVLAGAVVLAISLGFFGIYPAVIGGLA